MASATQGKLPLNQQLKAAGFLVGYSLKYEDSLSQRGIMEHAYYYLHVNY